MPTQVFETILKEHGGTVTAVVFKKYHENFDFQKE